MPPTPEQPLQAIMTPPEEGDTSAMSEVERKAAEKEQKALALADDFNAKKKIATTVEDYKALEEILAKIEALYDDRESSPSFITVPNLSAAELVIKAEKEIDLTIFDGSLINWNFIKDEAGKQYEVLTHNFGQYVSSKEVRDFFKTQGFGGSSAAFIAWITKNKPEGFYTSISEKDEHLWREHSTRALYTPVFRHGDALRELSLYNITHGWDDSCVFVAFREVPL